MNSKLGTLLSIVLMLVGIALFSASVLAAAPVAVEVVTTRTTTTTQLATIANEEAAREAARSIQALNKLGLDIRFVGPTSVQVAAQ